MDRLPLKEGILSYTEQALIINQMIDSLMRIDPFINPDLGKIEPADKLDGMLAYANGVDWLPNGTGGKGIWRWNTTSSLWILVG